MFERRSGNFVEDLGLFSFQDDVPVARSTLQSGSLPEPGVRPGGIVEWLMARPGAGQLPLPCKSCRNPLVVVESGRLWIPLGSAMSLLYLAGESIRAEHLCSAQPLLRTRAGQSSNACVVRVCRPPGRGSTNGFPSGFIAAGKWRRKWAEVWACSFGRSGRNGNPYGPTYGCWSRRRLEGRWRPDGCVSRCCIAGAAREAAPRRGRSTMPRVLCVWFPKWPIQRLRSARPELDRSEVVLFAGQNPRPLITVCGPKAERLGIRTGQPLAEAKTLLPKAVFLPADVVADRSALCQLAFDCQCFSPLIGLEEGFHPESLLCEVSGCTHLWEGEEPFLQKDRFTLPPEQTRGRPIRLLGIPQPIDVYSSDSIHLRKVRPRTGRDDG